MIEGIKTGCCCSVEDTERSSTRHGAVGCMGEDAAKGGVVKWSSPRVGEKRKLPAGVERAV